MTASEDTATGRALIEGGSPVAGSMSRAAGTIVYEPAAAVAQVDARFAACLRTAAADAGDLPVGRERIRAGAALAFAVEYAVTVSRGGRPVRGDDFFAARAGGRPVADEVAEAVTGAARRSADERRVRHLGYLLAEVAFSSDVDVELALRALRMTERLGWRQLALLAGVGRRERVPLPMGPLEDEPRAWSAWGAREDVADLQRAGLLHPAVPAPRPGSVLPRLRAADLRLARAGVLVHRLLVLDLLHENAITAALADLGLPRS